MRVWWLQGPVWNTEPAGGGGAAGGGAGGDGGAGAGGSAASGGGGGGGAGGKGGVTQLGGGALDQAAAAALAAAGGDKGGDKSAGDGGERYWPKGLDEAWKGKDERETLDKIAEHLGKQPKAPAKPDGYKYEPSEAFQKRYGDLKDDPVMPLWREVAHEVGLNDQQFNAAFSRLYEKMAEKGLIDDPVNVEKQLLELGPQSGDKRQRMAEGARRVQATRDVLQGLHDRGELTFDEAKAAFDVAQTPAGVKALEKLFAKIGSEGLKGGGSGGGQPQMTAHEKAMRAFFPTMNGTATG